ncbi:MAG: hypothetical protein IJR85_05475 [Synergistaceae bacterium]|nr:hypothetical protein [Synergistaceae bacterium]
MKTSRRRYNRQYRSKRLYVDGYWNPEIVPTCNEHKRCGVCGSHVSLTGLAGDDGILTYIYECPTCGKSYGVQYDIRGCTEEPFASILSLMEIAGGKGA